MKERLRCKLFGHDFRRIIDIEDRGLDGDVATFVPSDFCRHCGLSKEELKMIKEGK